MPQAHLDNTVILPCHNPFLSQIRPHIKQSLYPIISANTANGLNYKFTPMLKSYRQPKLAGFTLIELSIVLVIIGLVIGGVLVGQDLISAANIRATVGQVEKFNTALYAFRTKYNGFPGDLPAATAAGFGMTVRSGAAGHGDGNGILEGCSAASVGINSQFGCETALLWSDLSFAELIDGSYVTATDAITPVAAGTQDRYMPAAKLGRGMYFIVFTSNRRNYYLLAGIDSVNAGGFYTLSSKLTPSEALSIDSKMDDGFPGTGIVVDRSGNLIDTSSGTTMPPPATLTCLEREGAGSPDIYGVRSSSNANSPRCKQRFTVPFQ